MANSRKRRFDRVCHSQMLPMGRWEIVESHQHLAIFNQRHHRFGVLRLRRLSTKLPDFFMRLSFPHSRGKHGDVLATVALTRRHVADAAVAVLFVVPLHEKMDPLTRRFEARERLVRIRWRVLQGPK